MLLASKLLLENKYLYIKFLLAAFLILFFSSVQAQYKVKGTVFDSSRIYPIESVTVLSSSGKGTVTDSMGHYQLDVSDQDSIWFSFLGKPTPKYPILKIADLTRFDIALRIKMNVMQEVRVRTHVYKEDSLQNRRDYAKAFDFKRPNISDMTSISSSGVGIDLDEVIRVFQFRKNRSMEKFRERLLEQERQKFVDHKFNKPLVRRLTHLPEADLDKFMLQYRPTYEFALYSSEYDFQYYIKKSGEKYSKSKTF
ncbi:MAG TPA: hypothetical protein VJ499_06930 [Flavisolibacter sp.]|nr:hypothetical protein [Flavisolibacter sp.]